MIGTSLTNYLFGAAGILMYALAGSIPWSIPIAFLLITLLGNAGFALIVKLGLNLKLREPNMFAPQMLFGGVVALGFLAAAPGIAFFLLAGLFVTAIFGLVQFEVRHLRLGWLALAVGSAVVFAWAGDRLALPASNTVEVVLLWVMLMLVFGRLVIIGAYVSFLRRRLRERNEQLEESLERIEALMSARARKEQELAIAQERQRIMREIHDGIGANLLTSLAMLQGGRMDQASLQLVLRECLDDLMLTVDSLELLENDVVALLATLRYRLEKRLLAAGIALDWQVAELPPLPWLAPQQALSVMRLLQEALANIVKHARATTVRVVTREREEGGEAGVEVTISDDGVGLVASASPGRGGHGLRNMRERAAGLGGRVDVTSMPRGTCVMLWLPLQRASAALAEA
jgi:signal transduction histidine kinase